MKMIGRVLCTALFLGIGFAGGSAQVRFSRTDAAALPAPDDSQHNAMGADLLVSLGGFGGGVFYRHEFSDVLSSFVDFSISESKDDDERDYIDYYGNRYTYNLVNRFLVLPLFVGVEQRLFKDEILDNFRPYVSAAAGPAMIYVFPNADEFFTALGKGQPRYTAGGFLGFGAYFGTEKTRMFGLDLRYYIIPYPNGIESLLGTTKTEFGGFYITINFGGAI
ncbi:MAG TPA: hypothetical protein VMW43_10540 [Bacteroidota bacterium]|nr:hypothetical protein [Bacteroidota bacterium]